MKSLKNYILASCGMVGCLIICGVLSYFLFPDLFNLEGILPTTGEEGSQGGESFNVWDQTTEAQDVKLKADLYNIKIALEQFYVENGFYPENLSTLVQEGYISNISINVVILEYERISPDDYRLSVTLSNGEEYTLTPY